MIFFPDGVIGAEYNYRGPKVSAIPWYLRETCPDLPPIKANLLMNKESAEQVKKMKSYTTVEIEITRGNLEIAKEASSDDDIFEAFEEPVNLFGGEKIKIEVTHAPRKWGPLRTDRFPFIRRVAENQPLLDAADRFRITGLDPTMGEVVVDLLGDRLVSYATVAKIGRNRVVATRDMFDAIVAARNALKTEIDAAMQIDL